VTPFEDASLSPADEIRLHKPLLAPQKTLLPFIRLEEISVLLRLPP